MIWIANILDRYFKYCYYEGLKFSLRSIRPKCSVLVPWTHASYASFVVFLFRTYIGLTLKKIDNTIFYLSGVTGLNNSFHSTSLRVYDLIERSLNYSILPHMWATERNTVKKTIETGLKTVIAKNVTRQAFRDGLRCRLLGKWSPVRFPFLPIDSSWQDQ